MAQQLVTSASDKVSQLHSGHQHGESFVDDPVVVSSALNETMLLQRNTSKRTAGTQSVGKSGFGGSHLPKEPQGLIHSEYCVLIFALLPTHYFSCQSLILNFRFSFPFDGVH